MRWPSRALVCLPLAGASALLLAGDDSFDCPPELVKHGPLFGTAEKAVYEELHRTWYDWDTLAREVRVTRRERESSTSAWSEQVLSLSTPYRVTDVRAKCLSGNRLEELFVAGLDDEGTACIERWTFAYPEADESKPHVRLEDRPLPRVDREELYRDRTLGSIAALEPDPDGRFVLFLTFESPAVYRIDLPSGGAVLELSTSDAPALARSRQLVVRHHATEGRSFHLYENPRWIGRLLEPQDVVMLPDVDGDGVFESAQVISTDDWDPLGYSAAGVWVSPCE